MCLVVGVVGDPGDVARPENDCNRDEGDQNAKDDQPGRWSPEQRSWVAFSITTTRASPVAAVSSSPASGPNTAADDRTPAHLSDRRPLRARTLDDWLLNDGVGSRRGCLRRHLNTATSGCRFDGTCIVGVIWFLTLIGRRFRSSGDVCIGVDSPRVWF